jgi:heme-degrading monooxygenase HmoA
MTHARVGIYTAQPAALDEIIGKARAELVPLTRRQPGLRRYYAIRSGPDTAASVTTWETEAQAQAAAERLAGWVRRELGSAPLTVENHIGEIVISHVLGGAVEGHAHLSLWRVQPGATDGMIARFAAEFAPAVAAVPGFVGYGVARTGPDTLAAITVIDSATGLESALSPLSPLVQRLLAGQAEQTARYVGPIIWSVTGAGR